MSVTKMIERGWLQEVDASSSRGEPLWRETGDGHGTTLVVTDAGLLAIGIEPATAQRIADDRKRAGVTTPFGNRPHLVTARPFRGDKEPRDNRPVA